MKNKKSYLYLSLFFILFLEGCNPVKTSVKRGASKLFETFYLGEKGTQYFIKPLDFESEDGCEISIDFTFRHNGEINPQDSATANFSVLPPKDIKKKVEAMTLQIDKIIKKSGKIKILFKNANQSRFSTQVQLFDLKAFFEAEKRILNLDKGYTPKKSTKKRIEKLNKKIFQN